MIHTRHITSPYLAHDVIVVRHIINHMLDYGINFTLDIHFFGKKWRGTGMPVLRHQSSMTTPLVKHKIAQKSGVTACGGTVGRSVGRRCCETHRLHPSLTDVTVNAITYGCLTTYIFLEKVAENWHAL